MDAVVLSILHKQLITKVT